MAAEHFITFGNSQQIIDALKGVHLKGRQEPRIAFVGRSNVGKSSLINALTASKVAQVSREPGKTRLLHFYQWADPRVILADLPGYGYARASHEDRDRWAEFIETYLQRDEALTQVLVLLDARHGPTEIDAGAIRFIQGLGVRWFPVFTKLDEVKTQADRSRRLKEAKQALKELGWESAEPPLFVSSREKKGLHILEARLRQVAVDARDERRQNSSP